MMNNIKTKLNNFIDKKKKQIQKGKEISAQKQAERQRKKIRRIQDAKPSALTTVRRGLITNAKPWEVMKEEYYRRKHERESR